MIETSYRGWVWPLPAYVPWDAPSAQKADAIEGRSVYEAGWVYLTPPFGTCESVHAVDEGTIEAVSSNSITIKTSYGYVEYDGLWVFNSNRDAVGSKVTRGTAIGGLQRASLAIRALASDKGPTDTTGMIRDAWLRVTERFHRDAPKPPGDGGSRRELIDWLHAHKLWTHPQTVKVPANFESWFEAVEGSPKGYKTLAKPKPDWETHEFDEGSFRECVEIDFWHIDPTCGAAHYWVKEDPRDTQFAVFLEGGGWYDQSKDGLPEPRDGWDRWNMWGKMHDIDLDCGGNSLESALIQLACRVKWFYGEGRERDESHSKACIWKRLGEAPVDREPSCEDAMDGFCKACGYLILVGSIEKAPYEKD